MDRKVVGKVVRVSKLLGLVTGVAAAGLAVKHMRRPKDVRWLDHAHLLPHARSSSFRVVQGVRVHFHEKNRKGRETIVLLHGYCSSSYTWSGCLELLAEAGYRIIAPDLKGFGFSEKPFDNRYRVEDQSDLIVGLLDSLNIERATFVGNSYGGAISMATAIRHSHRVERLVLLNAAHDNTAFPSIPAQYVYHFSRLFSPVFMGSQRIVRAVMSRMYHDQSVVTDSHVDAYLRPLSSAACQAAALATFRQWDMQILEQGMHTIKHPTLVIWGEKDRLLPVHNGAKIHLMIQGSEFIVIPECGHLPQEERPSETVEMIVDFCSRRRLPEQIGKAG